MKLKQLVVAPLLVASLALTAAGCSSSPSGNTSSGGGFSSGDADYDAIINAGAVADDATISANQWASAIKANGTFKVGGVDTSQLFSQLDPTTNQRIGFDAGLSQLLSRYILGKVDISMTNVTSATREEVLTSNTVDAVFATYSITDARMQKINFAGPYYQSQAAILVAASNTSINSVADLAGKRIATQAGSTGEALLKQYVPDAKSIDALQDSTACVSAVEHGQDDAYVIDQTLLLGTLVTNTDVKIVGDPFGPIDAYGIGVNKDNDGKAFIDAWLQKIDDDGTWLKLWQATIQKKTNATQTPTPPAINSANNG